MNKHIIKTLSFLTLIFVQNLKADMTTAPSVQSAEQETAPAAQDFAQKEVGKKRFNDRRHKDKQAAPVEGQTELKRRPQRNPKMEGTLKQRVGRGVGKKIGERPSNATDITDSTNTPSAVPATGE